MSSTERLLSELTAHWQRRYGHVIATLEWSEDQVSGHVLTANQHAELTKALAPQGVRVTVDIWSQRDTLPPLGWGRTDAVLSVYREPGLERLSTEIHPDEGALKLLYQHEGAILVQSDDETLGWVASPLLTRSPANDGGWGTPLLTPNATLRVDRQPAEALWQVAKGWLNTPYLLGGRSARRMDCSGLTSRACRVAFNAILPKHSTDQLRRGVRVGKDQMTPGTLVFARLRGTRVAHVGIVLGGDRGLEVLHASQHAGRVVRETMDDFWQGYSFMGCRKLFVLGDS